MHTIRRTLTTAAVSIGLLAALAVAIPPGVSAATNKPDKPEKVEKTDKSHDVSCATETRAGYARCRSKTRDRSDDDPTPLASSSPVGLSPAQITAAYGFDSTAKSGDTKTIAIVDAFHSPSAAADLAKFSSTFGLPPCTPESGCFTQVNQTGGTSYPAVDQGWALEIALDVQWAHAIAPKAKILLVEATTNSYANLLAAEDYARSKAQYVSNSWGSSEFSGESSFDWHFTTPANLPKVSFFVSAGDAGLPAEYPSSSPNVISVGGTRLANLSPTSFSETAWSSGGGGCSVYETATAAQSSFAQYGQVGCGGRRATPDVSLDADPASGVAVYNGTPYNGATGWYSVGGTSASAPMWAGRAAGEGVPVDSTWVYTRSSTGFRDITSGNNGAPAKVGFDLASGRGSWVDPSAPAQTTPAPVASFTTSCTNTTCTFRSTSTGSIDSYLWSGAVGGTSSQISTTFPNAVADYTVNLKVTGAGGSSTATDIVHCVKANKKNRYTCS